MATDTKAPRSASSIVLMTLAAGQFLMTLDSSVMNVSIATVAKDVGTDNHRHPDGDHALHARDGVADDHGRQDRRAHRAASGLRDRLRDLRRGSFITAIVAEPRRPDLGLVVPRGLGAALIMPAIVALVASNFPRAERPRGRTRRVGRCDRGGCGPADRRVS